MDSDLERRVGQLETRLDRLERERAAEHRRRRRESWIRLAFLGLLVVAYYLYFRRVSGIL